MAKGKNNRRQQPGYFEMNIRAGGEDFLTKKNAVSIQKDANKIFKDIAYGNIRDEDINYFTSATFISNLMIVSNQNHTYHYYSYMGLEKHMRENSINDPNLMYVLNVHYNAAFAYSIITKYLGTIQYSISVGDMNGIKASLTMMINELKPRRIGLNSTFIVVDPTKNNRPQYNNRSHDNRDYNNERR